MSASPLYTKRALYATGKLRVFSGRHLREIAFPIGGSGAGTVSLGGRGQLRDWAIFNRPGKHISLPCTFFAIRTQVKDADPVVRVLESRIQPPYRDGAAAGLPRLKEAHFTGAYPFARIHFKDDALPLKITLEAFNPFIPMNADDSGLPVAIFLWTLTNRSGQPVDTTIAYSQLNPVGYDGQTPLCRRRHALFGGNINAFIRQPAMAGLKLTGTASTHPSFGSMAVVSSHPDVTYQTHWERAEREDGLQQFWDGFRADGRLPEGPDTSPSPEGETDVGTLGLIAAIPPGETVTLPFVIGWHFPNRIASDGTAESGHLPGNHYATRFPDAWAVADYTMTRFDRLMSETRLYHDTLFESAIPSCILDAVSSQATVLHASDPSLEQCAPFETAASSVGQMMRILDVYRAWQRAGDLDALTGLWPQAKATLEATRQHGDADQDGVMEGTQHTACGVAIHGPNAAAGAWYLCALKAAAEMAEAVGDTDAFTRYRTLCEQGCKRLDETLWNGEFYEQKMPDDIDERRYQYGKGCVSDQLAGQWFAMAMGLGRLLPRDHITAALESIFRYNFLTDFSDHHNGRRAYALNDEHGLLLCAWPHGGRPAQPYPFAGEVWTGVEYQVAAHMMYEGMLDEGLTIVKAVRDRYDGERRNPWSETTYAPPRIRAMSAWSLLSALSGCRYSAPARWLTFAPRWKPERFACWFMANRGWGWYTQRAIRSGQRHHMEVRYGRLTMQRLSFGVIGARPPEPPDAVIRTSNREVFAVALFEEDTISIDLSAPITVNRGEHLEVALTWA